MYQVFEQLILEDGLPCGYYKSTANGLENCWCMLLDGFFFLASLGRVRLTKHNASSRGNFLGFRYHLCNNNRYCKTSSKAYPGQSLISYPHTGTRMCLQGHQHPRGDYADYPTNDQEWIEEAYLPDGDTHHKLSQS